MKYMNMIVPELLLKAIFEICRIEDDCPHLFLTRILSEALCEYLEPHLIEKVGEDEWRIPATRKKYEKVTEYIAAYIVESHNNKVVNMIRETRREEEDMKNFLITLKFVRKAKDGTCAVRYADSLAFLLREHDGMEETPKWSVQELPDDDDTDEKQLKDEEKNDGKKEV